MKILLCSHFFHPSVGGIEEVSDLLAHQFTDAGHEVAVVTETSGPDPRETKFEVHRRPGPAKLLRLAAWSDVVFHNNISLRAAWPLLFINRPWVIAHHTWIRRVDGSIGWRDSLKQFVSRNARNITVSRAMSEHLRSDAVLIGNPYRDGLFRLDPTVARDLDLVFLGRLVSDKGLDLLLRALTLLRQKNGLRPGLTVIGSGPEEPILRDLVTELALHDQVKFIGKQSGPDLARQLNRHRFIVAPSRWHEPFGLIVLEGLACGCVPVAARCGGLPDAMGPCGVTFEHESATDLADVLGKLLEPSHNLEPYLAGAAEHLARHTAEAVARQYLEVLQDAAKP